MSATFVHGITVSGTRAKDWYIENAKVAMENGKIAYAGKYSEPDYEMILASSCKLPVQSTMANHAPEVKEKLLDLGIPVLVDQSNYMNGLAVGLVEVCYKML